MEPAEKPRTGRYGIAIHITYVTFILGAPLAFLLVSGESTSTRICVGLALALLSVAHGWIWFRLTQESRVRGRPRERDEGDLVGTLFMRLEAQMYALVIFGVVAWLALLITLVLDGDYIFAGVLGGGTVLAVLIARWSSKSTASPRKRRRPRANSPSHME